MKNCFFGILFCLSITLVFAQKNKEYLLSGNISGFTKDTVVYLVLNQTGDSISSTIVHNGKFSFKGHLPSVSAEWASVRIANATNWPTFFLSPGKLNIKGIVTEWKAAIVTGSKETIIYYGFVKSREPYVKQLDSLGKIAATTKDSASRAALDQRAGEIQKQLQEVEREFINDHPNSVYAAWLIKNIRIYNTAERQTMYDKLTDKIKQTHFGIELKNQIMELTSGESIKKGSISPDFIVETEGGERLSLKEIAAKNELTLVDFWASWCKPCLELAPELKKVYADFHAKGLGLLGVSSDKNINNWKNTLKKEQYPWINTRVINGEVDPWKIFGLQGYPAFLLLDKESKLIAIYNPPIPISNKTTLQFGFKNGLKDSQDIYDTIAEIMEKIGK